MEISVPWKRLGVISRFAEKSHCPIGRTALMKFAYLLQTLKNVPLGYDFRLYSHGPFKADVLDDLEYAEELNLVEVSKVQYSQGYGYRIQAGKNADFVKSKGDVPDFLSRYGKDIDWIVETFGGRSAGELELISTIVFVDREQSDAPTTLDSLVKGVREIKPQFSPEEIRQEALGLLQLKLLKTK